MRSQLGASLPLADVRIVEPQVLVEAQVAFALLILGLGEQQHQFLIGAAAIDEQLLRDIGFVFFFLLDVAERLVVTAGSLPFVDLGDDLAGFFRRQRQRRAGQQKYDREKEPNREPQVCEYS